MYSVNRFSYISSEIRLRRSSLTSENGLNPAGLRSVTWKRWIEPDSSAGAGYSWAGVTKTAASRASTSSPLATTPRSPPLSFVVPSDDCFARSANGAPPLILTRISSIETTACCRASASEGENLSTISAT